MSLLVEIYRVHYYCFCNWNSV